jgi:hypothetical protein
MACFSWQYRKWSGGPCNFVSCLSLRIITINCSLCDDKLAFGKKIFDNATVAKLFANISPDSQTSFNRGLREFVNSLNAHLGPKRPVHSFFVSAIRSQSSVRPIRGIWVDFGKEYLSFELPGSLSPFVRIISIYSNSKHNYLSLLPSGRRTGTYP